MRGRGQKGVRSEKLRPILALLVVSAAVSMADDRRVVTILDFDSSGIGESEVRVFVDYVTSHIADTGLYRVIDRMQRESLLKEIEFSQSDCTDENCQLELGRLLSANLIVVGSIGKVGTRYLLNVKLIEVETGETQRTASERYTSMDVLIDGSAELVGQLLAEPGGVRVGPSRGVGIGLLTGGLVAVGGGGGTFLFYLQQNALSETKFVAYEAATADFDNLWVDYSNTYFISGTLLWSSVGLWAGGAIATTIGIVILATTPKTPTPVAVLVVPTRTGVTLSARIPL